MKKHGTLADLPHSGRPSAIIVTHFDFIDQQKEDDREIFSRELCRLLYHQFGFCLAVDDHIHHTDHTCRKTVFVVDALP